MSEPVIKIPKEGKDINSKNIGDFLIYSKFNNLKIFQIIEGETIFTAYDQHNTYEYRHNLGYQPMVFGFFTNPYNEGADGLADTDTWFLMNSSTPLVSGEDDNVVSAGWEYNDIANAGTPGWYSWGSNDSNEFITLHHYHRDNVVGTSTDLLPVTSKYKLIILATPEGGAWY